MQASKAMAAQERVYDASTDPLVLNVLQRLQVIAARQSNCCTRYRIERLALILVD